MTDTTPTLARVLSAHLRDRGLSHADAARLTGVPQPTVTRIANGARDPGLTTLLRLLGGLGLSLRWLHDQGLRPANSG